MYPAYVQNKNISFIPLEQKPKLNLIKKFVKIKIFATLQCLLKTLKFDKAPLVNYPDLECLIEKINGCKK